MEKITVTPGDVPLKRSNNCCDEASIRVWGTYTACYNELANKIEAAGIEPELLKKVIATAIEVDNLGMRAL